MLSQIQTYLKEVEKGCHHPVRICLFGFGTTNRAILDAIISSDIKAEITLRQNGKLYDTPPQNVTLIQGPAAFENICEDVIFASPSLRREKLSIPRETVVTSDTDIFFSRKRDNMFLVSGSDGKSTVTTLTSLLLSPTFPALFIGGNIGTPIASAPISSDAFVLEVSSFNLRYTKPLGGRALLTNVTPNHLDWHSSLTEYEDCKRAIIESADEAILPLSCPFNEELAKGISSFALTSMTYTDNEIRGSFRTQHTVTVEGGMICRDGRAVLPINSIRRRERHNVENLMSAIALSIGYASDEQICKVAKEFSGLEHRCEHFTINGREYINSSIDTTPERTKATLTSLNKRVNIILGGRGKGLLLDPMKNALIQYADRIAIYGEISDEIVNWIKEDGCLSNIPYSSFSTLKEAIDYTDSYASSDTSTLLSPAATGYGEFRSYVERGRFFKAYLKEKHTKI